MITLLEVPDAGRAQPSKQRGNWQEIFGAGAIDKSV